MSVNTAEITTVFNKLKTEVLDTVSNQYDIGRLKGPEFAKVLANTLNTMIALAVSSVQEQPLIDMQVLADKVGGFATLANSQKQVELKDAQKALVQAQILLEVAKQNNIGAKSAAGHAETVANVAVKNAQEALIELQKDNSPSKIGLLVAQKNHYDAQVDLAAAKLLTSAESTQAAATGTLVRGIEGRIEQLIDRYI